MKKLAIVLALIFSPLMATAADAPACNAKNVGVLQCMEQKQCECKYFHKSAMAGTPERFAWDCGINRGPCIDHQTIESTKPYDGPDAVSVDRNTIRIDNR